MKTLTKILSVTALIVLCVCLFTLTAFAEDPRIAEIYTAKPGDCWNQGNDNGIKLSNGEYYRGTTTKAVGDPVTATEVAAWTHVNGYSDLQTGFQHQTGLSLTIDVAPTCTEPGKSHYECTCGQHFMDANATTPGDIYDAPLGHQVGATPTTKAKPATCVNSGNVDVYNCTRTGCGKPCNAGGKELTYDEIYIPADPSKHQFGGWTVLKTPTDVSPGQQRRTCSVCGTNEYEEIPALGITPADGGQDIDYVIPIHDTWMRGEEPLTFESSLVKRLNDASGPNANWVGVRVGTDSLYENSWDTFDFWSWDKYVKLGDKTMAGLREGKYRLWIYDKIHPDQYTCSCDFWVVDVPTLEPYSTDKHVVNSSKSLRFIASEEMQPDSIMVGSRKLYDASDYFVSNDRKNVTLSPDFLNARQTGTYTISAQTKDGRTIKTNFYILSTAQASSSPRTGDESQIGLWAAFLLLSGAAIVVMVPKLRKHGVK